jgi:hypothetical protein
MTQRTFAEYVTAESISKQFLVYGPKDATLARSKKFPLDPDFLAVSCERIKQVTLTELNGIENLQAIRPDINEGKIYVVLHPGVRQIPTITPIRAGTSFNYRVDLPNQIEGARLIETITEAVLLEIANRNSPKDFTRLPQWLCRGVAAHVKATSPETLLLQPNFPISISKVKNDPIAKICKQLENFAPLTFTELSQPEKLSPERAKHFDDCAQLFVHELTRLNDGRAGLRRMLDEMPRQTDWQTAFLAAFHSDFSKTVDVEKWWDLRVVTLSGRDASKLWSHAQSVEMLDTALRVVVEKPGGGATRNQVSLQEIISTWEPALQKPALQKVINQLRALRIRIQPDLVVLLDEYYGALKNYLDNNEKQNLLKRIFARENIGDLKLATRERLDALDRLRAEARNQPKPATREEAIRSALEIASQNARSEKH